jgi:hypothetical protein
MAQLEAKKSERLAKLGDKREHMAVIFGKGGFVWSLDTEAINIERNGKTTTVPISNIASCEHVTPKDGRNGKLTLHLQRQNDTGINLGWGISFAAGSTVMIVYSYEYQPEAEHIQKYIASYNPVAVANASVQAAPPAASPADEILKYKNLLDVGAITQDEFDAKKKQLLGL